jgi:hypothetical protein
LACVVAEEAIGEQFELLADVVLGLAASALEVLVERADV